jgi:hypothetical protein
MKLAATIATVLLVVVIVFQLALALGAPLGKAAWGGRHQGVLPTRFRIASGVVGAIIYPLIIVGVLDATFGDDQLLPGNGAPAMWVLTAVFTVGAVANFVSRSPVERLWTPVSAGIAVCCSVIASGL